MLAKVITLHFDPLTGRFADEPLLEFIKDKKIIKMREHFFKKEGVPYLAVFITFENTVMKIPKSEEKKEEQWRELIGENELPLFNTLRSWRKERCQADGIPPYVVCTNKTLANLVLKRPQSLAELGQVEGFGKAKLEKYGADIIKLLVKEKEEGQ